MTDVKPALRFRVDARSGCLWGECRAAKLVGQNGAIVMTLVRSRIATAGSGVAAVLLLGIGTAWAGLGVPAPLIGVTGPVGIVAAGVAYGGYWLYRRYRQRS
jgi:RimJ/RimL family protein N-acetyltransferase